jgi:hypothetical protein
MIQFVIVQNGKIINVLFNSRSNKKNIVPQTLGIYRLKIAITQLKKFTKLGGGRV